MKKHLTNLISALIAFSLCSCGDSHDDITEDMIEHLDKAGDILTKLAEGGSEEDAIADLKELSDEGKDLAERMEKLGEPDEEADKQLGKKYDEKMTAAQEKVSGATSKLASSGKWTPELQNALASVMPDVD